jgi:6-phosphogluconolactonase
MTVPGLSCDCSKETCYVLRLGSLMGNTSEILIFSTNQAVADFVVIKWMEISAESIEDKGYFSVALSGGKTPIDFYTMLSARGTHLPWEKTHIFLVDERLVPHSHKESNFRLLREYLLKHLEIPKSNVHYVQTMKTTLDRAAERYEDDILHFFNIQRGSIPEFDLIVLGIGEDGHTASLFPGTPSLGEGRRVAISDIAEKASHRRISLSLPVLTHAKQIIFLVTGAPKAGIVKEIVEDNESKLPASLVRRRGRNVYLVMDEDAASLLSRTKNKL